MYGYVTATRQTIILILDDVDLRESEVKQLAKKIHRALVAALCNPFAHTEAPIESTKFDAAIGQIVASF